MHLPPQILIANNNCNTLPKVLTKKLYIYPQILVILNLLDFGSLKFKFLSGSWADMTAQSNSPSSPSNYLIM